MPIYAADADAFRHATRDDAALMMLAAALRCR